MKEEMVCGEETQVGLPDYIWKEGYKYPDCYQDSCLIAEISKKIKETEKQPFCCLPFDQCVIGEHLGGRVSFGEDNLGPRLSALAYQDIDEILRFPVRCPLDGRMGSNVSALKMLMEEGQEVIYNLDGPMSILSGLMPMERFFVQRRRKEDSYHKLLARIAEEIISCGLAVLETGCQLISLADPVGCVELLGPKVMEEVVRECYEPILQKLNGKGAVIHLCPKLYAVLAQFSGIEVERILGEEEDYRQQLLQKKGKSGIVAGSCLKKVNR